MGSNILGKHVSFERKKWLAHASASAAKIKRKPLTQLKTMAIRVR
jgi:hypothetical protein